MREEVQRDERGGGNGRRRRRWQGRRIRRGRTSTQSLSPTKRPENPKGGAIVMLIRSRRFIKSVGVNHEIHGPAMGFRVVSPRCEIESSIICPIVVTTVESSTPPLPPPAILHSTYRTSCANWNERFYYSREFNLCFEHANIVFFIRSRFGYGQRDVLLLPKVLSSSNNNTFLPLCLSRRNKRNIKIPSARARGN